MAINLDELNATKEEAKTARDEAVAAEGAAETAKDAALAAQAAAEAAAEEAKAKDGVTPKLQATDTAIQVSYDGGTEYEDLVQLSALKGDTGENGADGATGEQGEKGADGTSPLLRKWGSTIQVANDGVNYRDLVLLSDIKGDKGDIGATGADGTPGAQGNPGTAGDKGDKGRDAPTIKSFSLATNDTGKIVSGRFEFANGEPLDITVSVAAAE